MNVRLRDLLYVAQNSDKYYYLGKRFEKDDGTFRQTYGASKRLKIIQQAILRKILHQVSFPPYLFGGIKGRSHIKSASLHSGKKILIGEDVENFFPSISSELIEHIWKYFFHFPPDVAAILTDLTSYRGSLPQGAVTSTYIANLIFWDKEPVLDIRLRKMSFDYGRYIDDSNASSKKVTDQNVAKWVQAKIKAMYSTKRLKAKPAKSQLLRCGERMTVHNLTVNGATPTLAKPRQTELKRSVTQIEKQIRGECVDLGQTKEIRSLKGKLQNWNHLQPHKAQPLLERLAKRQPR